MSLPPAVQTRYMEIIQLLGLQGVAVESIEFHIDKDGTVQKVKPRLSFERRQTPREDRT